MTLTHMKFNLQGVPENAIPPAGTKHRIMLDLYLTGEEVKEDTLVRLLGRNCRGTFQALTGDRFGYWHFIDVLEDGKIDARYLDKRHLSGDYEQDALARAERKVIFKTKSHKQAKGGAIRERKALAELEKSHIELNALEVEELDKSHQMKMKNIENRQ